MKRTIAILIAISLVLTMIGVVGAGGQGDTVECTNTDSGETFDVPEDRADDVEDNPHVECEDDDGPGGTR